MISVKPTEEAVSSSKVVRNDSWQQKYLVWPAELNISSFLQVSVDPELTRSSSKFVHFESKPLNNPNLSISTPLLMISVKPASESKEIHNAIPEVNIKQG